MILFSCTQHGIFGHPDVAMVPVAAYGWLPKKKIANTDIRLTNALQTWALHGSHLGVFQRIPVVDLPVSGISMVIPAVSHRGPVTRVATATSQSHLWSSSAMIS